MISTLSGALGLSTTDVSFWLPLVLFALLILVVFASVLLDGFDIGVGLLLGFASDGSRDTMMSHLSPWRDANEMWLLLGLGLFLAAFPHAWTPIMKNLFLPLALLGAGTLLRSGAFELSMRSPFAWRGRWAMVFSAGAWCTAIAHGLALSRILTAYITGTEYYILSSMFVVFAIATYILLGATWLLMRATGDIRVSSALWARQSVRWCAAGVVSVAVVLASGNQGVLIKWVDNTSWELILILWATLITSFIFTEISLNSILRFGSHRTTIPYVLVILIIFLLISSVVYSFFPYFILDNITIWDAAASTLSLQFVIAIAVVIVPLAIVFNIWVYRGVLFPSK